MLYAIFLILKKIINIVTWVFGLVIILLFKKSLPLYESVGSNPEIFKIYMCVSLN